MNSTQDSRFTLSGTGLYLAGLVLSAILLVTSVYIFLSEISQLTGAIESEKVVIRLDSMILFIPGGLLAVFALGFLSIAGLFKIKLSTKTTTIANLMFVSAVVLGMAGRLVVPHFVDQFLQSKQYFQCAERS